VYSYIKKKVKHKQRQLIHGIRVFWWCGFLLYY